MKMKHLIYCLCLSMIIYNCSSSSSDDVTNPDPDPDPTEKLTYEDDIKSIISGNCLNCHGNPTDNGAPFSLATYNSAKNRINGIISRINNASNPMPPSGLMPQGLRDDIQQWKDDGLLED